MIRDPNFSLNLESHWVEIPGDDPGQYNLRDTHREVVMTLSGMPIDVAAVRMDEMANILVELRLKGERDAANVFGHHAVIYEPIIAPRAWGRAVAYYGHDNTGRQFSFSGSITSSCVISLYGSSSKLSEQELLAVMDEVLSRIEFDQTPLRSESHPG